MQHILDSTPSESAIVIGTGVSLVGYLATHYQDAGNLIAAATDPNSSDLWTAYAPQLGIFVIVVIVAKFFLGRQDAKDAESDKRDHELIDVTRQQLKEEREMHEETRKKLYDALRQLQSKEDIRR